LRSGSLYKGVKPVMWSVVEKTALAEAEVEYREHKSVTIWIKFAIVSTKSKALEGAKIVIWTTTPWTMPSNRAVAFGKDIDYGVFEVKKIGENSRAEVGEKLVLALSLAESVKAQAAITQWEQTATLKGSDVEGTICAHPFRGHENADGGYDFDVPALEADFVTEDAGTGFVHIAPGHGADDFYLGQENGIEVTDNVADDGKFRPHVPLFAEMEVYTDQGEMGGGNFAVLKEMAAVGGLLAKGSLRHEYPHSWRSKAPLIFRTTPQWFIALDDDNNLRDVALQAIEDTRWVPAQSKNRIKAMIQQRPDWCISRQRTWGVPIALFLNKETGETLMDEAVLSRIGDLFDKEGSDSWWARPAQDFLGDDYRSEDFTQVFDIVDVWFESGCTHAYVAEAREDLHWPADLYLEGSDQHRGWFHSSLLESCGTRGRAPYNAVLTHGFIVDQDGRKMSKSEGNVIAPSEVWDEHGADILRLWSITVDYTADAPIGEKILKSTSDIYRRIRNTFRFLLGALDGMTKEEMLDPSDYKNMPEAEQLILHQLAEMDKFIRENVAYYEFGKIAHRLHAFCNNELSAFYFDIRKDRLYCDRPDMFERRATRTVLAHVLECLNAWLAPVLCFTAEEVWQMRPDGLFSDAESIHLCDFPQIPDSWHNTELAEKWLTIRAARDVVLGAIEPYRRDKTIGSSLEACPQIYVSAEYAKALEGQDMAEICITSQAEIIEGQAPENAFTLEKTEGVGVMFQKAEGQKCARCWKVLPEVGTDPDYPDLTLRDADAVRWYVAQSQAA